MGWLRTLNLRGREIEGHSQRVTDHTLVLAKDMGIAEDALAHMRHGALVHDKIPLVAQILGWIDG